MSLRINSDEVGRVSMSHPSPLSLWPLDVTYKQSSFALKGRHCLIHLSAERRPTSSFKMLGMGRKATGLWKKRILREGQVFAFRSLFLHALHFHMFREDKPSSSGFGSLQCQAFCLVLTSFPSQRNDSSNFVKLMSLGLYVSITVYSSPSHLYVSVAI